MDEKALRSRPGGHGSLAETIEQVETIGRDGRPRYAYKPSVPISVVIADGQALFRSGLTHLLEEDPRLRVLAVSESGAELLDICAANRVDVIVTDLELPDLDVLELIRVTSSTFPATRVLVLGSVADWRVFPVMAAGAAGFLVKDAAPEGLRSAVISVHSGDQVLSREAAQWLMSGTPARYLTPRETDVLHHVTRGSANSEIAEALHLSEKTVRNYVSRLYRKLALQSRSQMAHFALGVSGPGFRAAPEPDGASGVGAEAQDRR